MDSAKEIQRRAVVYRKFLLGGTFAPQEITNMIPLWNQAMGATKTADAGWMPTAHSPTTVDLAALATHAWVQADRVATGLARLKLLKYGRAEHESRHQLLNLHVVQAGLPLQVEATIEAIQESFKSAVPGPIVQLADLPDPGMVRCSPLTGYDYTTVPDALCHDEEQKGVELLWTVPLDKVVESPGAQWPEGVTLETATMEQLQAAMSGRKPPQAALISPRKATGKLFESGVPPDEKENDLCRLLLEQYAGMPPGAKEVTRVEETPRALGNSTEEIQQMQAKLASQDVSMSNMQKTLDQLVDLIVKRESVDLQQQQQRQRVDPEQQQDEAKSNALAVVEWQNERAPLELDPEIELEVLKRKKALMERVLTGGVLMGSIGTSRSLGEMRLSQDEDATRVLADTMKVEKPASDYEWQYNTVIDEHTAQVIRLRRIEALSTMPLDEEEQRVLLARQAVAQQDCEVLRKKREILSVVLKQHNAGRPDLAEGMMRLFREEARGYARDPDAERLLKKAKQESKEDESVRLLKALESRNSALESLVASSHASGSSVRNQSAVAAQVPGKPARPGASPAQRVHSVRWVDGSVFNASLAGVMTPDPGMFPMGPRFKMDAANGGIVNSAATCSLVCSGCSGVGHQFSECPPRDEQRSGKRYVNFRWLYEKKFCGPDGKPC